MARQLTPHRTSILSGTVTIKFILIYEGGVLVITMQELAKSNLCYISEAVTVQWSNFNQRIPHDDRYHLSYKPASSSSSPVVA